MAANAPTGRHHERSLNDYFRKSSSAAASPGHPRGTFSPRLEVMFRLLNLVRGEKGLTGMTTSAATAPFPSLSG